MEPTLFSGDMVFVSSLPFLVSSPKVGDIIAFEKRKKIFIKRIAEKNPSADREKYFVKGDNEKDSLDSMKFGWVDRKEIMGKVMSKWVF